MTIQLKIAENEEQRLIEEARRQNVSPEQYVESLLQMALHVSESSARIHVDPEKGPRIAGTRIKVVDIAIVGAREGRTPHDVAVAFPHLSLAQIHAALSYYYEHKAEIDAAIERTLTELDRLKSESEPSPFELRMRSEGRIP